MATGSVRLFAALWPPTAVREALAALAHRWHGPHGAKRVDPAKFHVTPHFLGRVDAMDALVRSTPGAGCSTLAPFGAEGA